MNDAPRTSIDSRYERETEPHAAKQALTPAGCTAAPSTMSPQPVFGLPVWPGMVAFNTGGGPGCLCPVCCRPAGEKPAAKPHAPDHAGRPAAPRFSKATPEVFRDGFKPLWDAAQADTAAYVVVSGCNKLLGVLLDDLERRALILKSDGADRSRSERGWLARWRSPPEPRKVSHVKRIAELQKKGLLLLATVAAARDSGLAAVLAEEIDAGSVTPEMARRYVQLLWQVADQGFEQPGWSQDGVFPKAVAAPAGDGH